MNISLGYSNVYYSTNMGADTSTLSRTSLLLDCARKSYYTATDIFNYFVELLKVRPREEANYSNAEILNIIFAEHRRALSVNPSFAEFFTTELAMKLGHLAVLRTTLSEKGFARIERLSKSLENWDGEGAKAMSLGALANFANFSRHININRKDLAIYLDPDGKILISWLLKNDSTIDIAIGESKIEVLTDDFEKTFAISDRDAISFIKEQ